MVDRITELRRHATGAAEAASPMEALREPAWPTVARPLGTDLPRVMWRSEANSLRVWTVANQKGGVGKTTTAVTMAGILSARGHSTLLVDLDAHGSLTSYFGLDPDTVQQSAYRLFNDGVPANPFQMVHETKFKKLYVMPASSAMATLDRQLGAQNGKGLVVSQAIKCLKEMFEYVIIDSPPNLGILMVNALAACEHLIIPVQTEFLAMQGLERMLHTLRMIDRSTQRNLPYTIVPTLFDRRTKASTASLELMRNKYPVHLWSSAIPVDTQFRDASRLGVPLPQRSMTSRGVIAYAQLVDMLEARALLTRNQTL